MRRAAPTSDVQASIPPGRLRLQAPVELVDQLLTAAELAPEASLLGYGAGTEQLGAQLAEHGHTVTAADPADLPSIAFDLVFAATALHVQEPAEVYDTPYELLKDDGYLAMLHSYHITDGAGDKPLTASLPLYDRYFHPGLHKRLPLPELAAIQPAQADVRRFKPIGFWKAPLVVRYTTERYAQLFESLPAVQSLVPEKRDAFMEELRQLVDKQFRGRVSKHYAVALTLVQKTRPKDGPALACVRRAPHFFDE